MPREVFRYDVPERFVAGTVGQPGQRTFFLQASSGGRVTSVALEKEQVALLAERLDALLDEVSRRSGGAAPVPASAPQDHEDSAPLDTPILEEFRVGTMTLAWEVDTETVVIEAQARTEAEESGEETAAEQTEDETAEDETAEVEALSDSDEGPPVLRVRMTAAMARAFAKRAQAVVAAGRPPCPFCGLPLSAEGHICPRQNGQRPSV
ncbi:MAG TPA: DUF3090 domain-containing protein [Actinomycetes bacterium]|nr:DUF3090 domain-containing protein [Actinomycetes bacterium]